MEEKIQLPTQQQMHMVVMLPKNAAKERPITLTSLLYRVWRRLRKPLLDEWQKQLPADMNHDKARPGAHALYVALVRLLRQEVHRANGRHGVTCLVDMSTFYDTINLQQLQAEALKLNYPPLMLEMALQVYHGPKAIVTEQEMTPFFTVTNGVPAGCPQACNPGSRLTQPFTSLAGWMMLALTPPDPPRSCSCLQGLAWKTSKPGPSSQPQEDSIRCHRQSHRARTQSSAAGR